MTKRTNGKGGSAATATKGTKKASGKPSVTRKTPGRPEVATTPTKANGKATEATTGQDAGEPRRLPAQMRVLVWPRRLWDAAKAKAQAQKSSTRSVIDAALAEGLEALVGDLMAQGLVPAKDGKRVRCSLDANILGALHRASDKVDLPMQRLLFLCLDRQLSK